MYSLDCHEKLLLLNGFISSNKYLKACMAANLGPQPVESDATKLLSLEIPITGKLSKNLFVILHDGSR